MVQSLSTCVSPVASPRWSTAVSFSTTTGAGQGTEAAITDSQPQFSWARSPDTPHLWVLWASSPHRHHGVCNRERGSCRLPARAAPACPTVGALRPLVESLEGTLPRWKDTGRAHPEPETVDFGDRHHKKGAAGRNASCFDLSLSEELLQRVTELMQVTHTEV